MEPKQKEALKRNLEDAYFSCFRNCGLTEHEAGIMFKHGLHEAESLDNEFPPHSSHLKHAEWRKRMEKSMNKMHWYDKIPGWVTDLLQAIVVAVVKKHI